MGEVKFTHQEIERFNDRIQNCLGDERCRNILKRYLEISHRPVLVNALNLWIEANKAVSFDDDMFFDLIDEVQGFNDNPLLTIAECDQKLTYVKTEACRILAKILPHFIEYLHSCHRL